VDQCVTSATSLGTSLESAPRMVVSEVVAIEGSVEATDTVEGVTTHVAVDAATAEEDTPEVAEVSSLAGEAISVTSAIALAISPAIARKIRIDAIDVAGLVTWPRIALTQPMTIEEAETSPSATTATEVGTWLETARMGPRRATSAGSKGTFPGTARPKPERTKIISQ